VAGSDLSACPGGAKPAMVGYGQPVDCSAANVF
jgi:hypothetical protein